MSHAENAIKGEAVLSGDTGSIRVVFNNRSTANVDPLDAPARYLTFKGNELPVVGGIRMGDRLEMRIGGLQKQTAFPAPNRQRFAYFTISRGFTVPARDSHGSASSTHSTREDAAQRTTRAREDNRSCQPAPIGVYRNYIRKGPVMSNLLLKLKSKNSPYGVTRETLKALAEEMDISETMVVHLAIAQFAKEVLPAYEMDDAPLSAADVALIRRTARPKLPKGKVLATRSLL